MARHIEAGGMQYAGGSADRTAAGHIRRGKTGQHRRHHSHDRILHRCVHALVLAGASVDYAVFRQAGVASLYGITGPESFVLPALTLGSSTAANIARLTRTSMLEILGQDYIRTAKGKGVQSSRVIWVHALRNAAVPVVTIIGLQFGVMLGGQVVTETVFSWPGVGRMIVDALDTRDLQIVQGGILILAFTFTIINLVTDLIYAVLDPRIRY